MILPANLLTGAIYPKLNIKFYNQNNTKNLVTYAQIQPNEPKPRFGCLSLNFYVIWPLKGSSYSTNVLPHLNFATLSCYWTQTSFSRNHKGRALPGNDSITNIKVGAVFTSTVGTFPPETDCNVCLRILTTSVIT